MKILWISSTPSHPQDTSSDIHLIGQQIMAAGHHITFLLYGQEQNNAEAKIKMQYFWSKFIFVPDHLAGQEKINENKRRIDDWFNQDIESYIKVLLILEKIDIVICEGIYFSKALSLFPDSVFKILHYPDYLSDQVAKQEQFEYDDFQPTSEHRKIAFDRANLIITNRLDPLLTNRTVLNVDFQQQNLSQNQDFLRCLSTKSNSHIRKKSTLVITDVRFWEPGLGSHSRILALCSELKQHVNLTIFFFGSISPSAIRLINKCGFEGQVISYKIFEQAGVKLDLKFPQPPHNISSGLKKKFHETFLRSLKAYLLSTKKFDVLIFEYLWLAYTREVLFYPALTILDTHDLMAYRDYRFSSQNMPIGISISLREELDLLEQFDVVLAIQHEEADILSSFLKKAIPLCCPHGIELPKPQISKKNSTDFKLGFIGGNSDANYAAIYWFIQKVWPIVNSLPISLHIYGSICDRFPQYQKNIELHGLVDDLSEAYIHCDIMINPMIHGGGIKIKSIEAMAYGKPLIASLEGAVGIDNPEQSGLIVAKNRKEFINAVLTLFNNSELCNKMSQSAREATRTQFSPNTCFSPLIEVIGAV